jgi:hypothetical protein
MDEREIEEARPRLVDFIYDQIGDTVAMTADGFDDAIIGIGSRCGQPDLLVYDVDTALDILMDRDGMDYEQAQEYFSFNVEGAWVGEGTPIWLHRIDGPELT